MEKTDAQIDQEIENTRTLIDSCMADPQHHLLLNERKPTILATVQAMARAQRARGRTDAAWYCEDMLKRLQQWQYDDD